MYIPVFNKIFFLLLHQIDNLFGMLDHLYAKFDKAFYAGLCKTIAVGEITTHTFKVLLSRACAPSALHTVCVFSPFKRLVTQSSSHTSGRGERLRHRSKECLRRDWFVVNSTLIVLLFDEINLAKCAGKKVDFPIRLQSGTRALLISLNCSFSWRAAGKFNLFNSVQESKGDAVLGKAHSRVEKGPGTKPPSPFFAPPFFRSAPR